MKVKLIEIKNIFLHSFQTETCLAFQALSRLSFLFLVSWVGVILSPLGTSPNIWPIVPAPGDRL
jgi:hypothetical protein